MNHISPRETALKILNEIETNHAYTNIALKKYLKDTDYKIADRALVTELIYGIIKYKITLDYIIEQFSSIKINKLSKWILNILRMGIYQIVYLDRIPDSAACNESVNLAKRYGHQGSVRYVNAVLRNISRNKNNISFPDKKEQPMEYLKIKYSFPEWLIEKWVIQYGYEFTESLCAASNQVADLSVRVNTLQITREELIRYLEQEGVQAVPGRYCSEALLLNNVGNIEELETFKKGFFQVQDESSMLVSKVLDPQPGEFVMDVCCAPGGKTTHIAQLMKNQGTVLGWDIHEHKIELVRNTANRLGFNIIRAELQDATQEVAEYFNQADKVLVDAPCTGLGILRRKPDIKWNKANEDLDSITSLQKRILHVSSQYVKKGGCLVYSTCTIQEEENIHIIREFMDSHPDFVVENIQPYFSQKLDTDSLKQGYVQLYPNIHRTDGFFMCKLRRRE